MTASNRPLVGPLVVSLVCSGLALTSASATASPYHVIAPVEPAPVPSASSPVPSDSAATSPSQPLSDDPALEYRLGEQAYALGNYEQAVRHFERSYQLSNHADLLYNLGMAYAQWNGLDGDVGHLRKARRLFQNYTKRLAENPQMDQSQREEAEAQVARLDEQISAYEARQAAAPAVKPDPEPQQPPPQDQPAKKPVYKRGWFWAVIGAVVVAGAVTAAVVLTRPDPFRPELGSIGPNSSPVGLRF